jgi:N-acetylated-alpha-linked acidic dipeptidase
MRSPSARPHAQKSLARTILNDVSGDDMWKHIECFSKIDRVSGTVGERKALQHICDSLKSYGIEPEVYEFESYISVPLKAELMVISPTSKSVHAITHSFATSTPPEGVEAELIYLKPPTRTQNPLLSRVEPEEYSQADLKGKIVLVDGTASPGKVAAAQAVGALAEIHISTEPMPHEMTVTTIWGTPTLESAVRIPRIPVASVGREHGEFLKNLCSRGKVAVRLKTEVSTAWRKIGIPVATIKGSVEPERFVLVGGHYCAWYAGVTDNATGDTALLEIARVAQKHRKRLTRSVKVAWWPGHSQGRYAGSTWFADNLFDELNKNAIAYVNIDSPGSKGTTMYDLEAMPEATDYAVATAHSLTKLKIQPLRPNRWGDQSFWGVGFPSISCWSMAEPEKRAQTGGSGGGWWWHTQEDTLDKADYDNQVRDTRVNLALVLGLCNSAVLPFDFKKMSDQYIESLTELASKTTSSFDLNPLISKGRLLRKKTTALNAAGSRLTKAKGVTSSERRKELNETYMRLSRTLVPALFTRAGRYDQDPAVDAPLFPGLQEAVRLGSAEIDADERGFLQTQMIRERNRISDALDQAIAIVDDCLAKLGE